MTSCIMNITTLCENEMTSMSRAWDTEEIESLKGFKPMTSQTLGGRSIHLSYGELMET